MADPSDFLAIGNFLNDDSSSAGSNLRSSMSELDSSCATSGAESEESPSTASARYAFGNVEIDPPDDESKISASLFVDEVGPKYGEEEDEEDSNDRVRLNVRKSNLNRYFHVMNPDAVTMASRNIYNWISFKFPCAYKKGMDLKIDEGGRSATCTLEVPELAQNPNNLIGKNLSSSHVLFQAVQQEIYSRKVRQDAKANNIPIVMKLPFKAHTSTSDDLFGEGTGQSAGFVMAVPKRETNSTANCTTSIKGNTTCNAVFVFKKHGNHFEVVSGVSTNTFDNRDLRTTLGGPPASPQAASFQQPAATASSSGGSGSFPSANTRMVPMSVDEATNPTTVRSNKGSKRTRRSGPG